MTDVTVTAPPKAARVPGGRKQKAGNRHGLAGFLFTLPFIVLFLGHVHRAARLRAVPERCTASSSSAATSSSGSSNYTDGLKDKQFTYGVGRVALFMLIQVPVMLFLALVFALILDSGRVWLAKFYRVGIFVPYAVPTVIAALMWGFLYGRDFGPFADLADALGLSPPNFLSEKTMLFSIANVSTWTYTGYNMIILYAALRSIPAELYEAAAVDGAGAVRIGDPHQAAAAAPGAAAVHDLLDHRLHAAVRRAADLLLDRAGRDRKGLHAEPLRVQPRLRRPAAQLRGRAVVPARARSCSCSRSS